MAKNGRPRVGPRPVLKDPIVDPVRIEISPVGSAMMELDPQVAAGLCQPFSGRARTVLLALLQGWSRTQAAAFAGVTDSAVRQWGQQDRAFSEAVEAAQSLGFARGPESELYKRAFAGEEDRGSMRALELIIKARSPEYREKVQTRLDVVHHAERMMGAMADGWRDDTLPSSNGPDQAIIEGESTPQTQSD
jgi:hypothetical protein